MPLEAEDIDAILDRIADKIELAVQRGVNDGFEKHIDRHHTPQENACNERFKSLESRVGATESQIKWGGGLLTGLALLWEYFKTRH